MKRTKSSTLIILVAITLVLMVSACLKDDMKKQAADEKQLIQDYISDHNISPDTKTNGGIYYIEKEEGTGRSPLEDNYIYIHFTGRYIEDGSVIETSYDTITWPTSNLFDFYLFGPVKLRYGHSMLGINEALSYMKEGGKSTVILPSNKANYDYKPLVYDLHLIKVIRDPIAYEDSVVETYLVQKGYLPVNKVDKIWYKETFIPNPADVEDVKINDTVYIRFEGRIIDGFTDPISDSRIFDSNMDDAQPLKYVYGSRVTNGTILNQSIPAGLKTAIDSMRVGVKASAVIPYKEAFGADGISHKRYKYTIIPGYQTVLYNIEVTAIKSGPGN
jgi:FKBP-type peptidyl-prolyl cis-trans isomerase